MERRGHPREIVEALLAVGADREYFADRDKLEGVAEKPTMPTRTVTVQRDEEHNRYQLQIEDRSSGYPRQHTIGVDFVTAGEYRTLLAQSPRHPDAGRRHRRRDDGGAGRRVRRARRRRRRYRDRRRTGRSRPGWPRTEGRSRQGQGEVPDVTLHSLDELVEYFIGAGKKGIAINRYKGLGEMNPDQLWATTMDPAVGTLLQVHAEDHTEADLMFTTLMGIRLSRAASSSKTTHSMSIISTLAQVARRM